MDAEKLKIVQQRVSSVTVQRIGPLHTFRGVPQDFLPWTANLSPSALYNCSTSCRKMARIKTPEVKWMSVKRWITTSIDGVVLPAGCFLSIKRKEKFVARPVPSLVKTDFTLVLLPYGNVWSQVEPGVPITEDWLWSMADGRTVFEHLVDRDAAKPVPGYFAACYSFMLKNPDQIGIHQKRKKQAQSFPTGDPRAR